MSRTTSIPPEVIEVAHAAGLQGQRIRIPATRKGEGMVLLALLQRGEEQLVTTGEFRPKEIQRRWGSHRKLAMSLGVHPFAVRKERPRALQELKRYWLRGEEARIDEVLQLGDEAHGEYWQRRRHIHEARSVDAARDIAAQLLQWKDSPDDLAAYERVMQLAAMSVADAWWHSGTRSDMDMVSLVCKICETFMLASSGQSAGRFPRTAYMLVAARFGMPSYRLAQLAGDLERTAAGTPETLSRLAAGDHGRLREVDEGRDEMPAPRAAAQTYTPRCRTP